MQIYQSKHWIAIFSISKMLRHRHLDGKKNRTPRYPGKTRGSFLLHMLNNNRLFWLHSLLMLPPAILSSFSPHALSSIAQAHLLLLLTTTNLAAPAASRMATPPSTGSPPSPAWAHPTPTCSSPSWPSWCSVHCGHASQLGSKRTEVSSKIHLIPMRIDAVAGDSSPPAHHVWKA